MNVLGRYQILEQLGTGSMGTVYRARDTRLDRDVALKTIRTSGEVEPEIRERFYREARACARLQHPNIVAVFDLGEEEKVAYIAMELLKGEDLRKVIEKRREIPLAKKLEAMIQICDALNHAHTRGVIHRDVKPSNIFLTEQGQAKALDFGIARLPSSRLTVAGNILGTPNYMAPEQMLGKPTDARTDLFSAALVFFELLTYVHPFHANVIPKRIVEGDPDSLFDHDSTMPVLLEKILSRALARDPEARYQTGEELGSDLRAVLDAVRLNASPTMSRVQLPSDRALPKEAAVPQGDLTLLKPAPEGEDPAEWRLSEVLRLIPEFEDAVQRKDPQGARSALDELKAIAMADRRFAEAAESCHAAYENAWGNGSGTSGAKVAPGTTAGNPAAVAAGAGATATAITAASPAAVQVPGKAAAPPAKPAPANRPGFSLQALTPDQKKAIAAAGIILLLIVVIGGVVTFLTRPETLRPAVASARVEAARAVVHKSGDANAAAIVEVGRGESLRLLELPNSRRGEWVWVQPVIEGKTKSPGFVRITDLSDWTQWTFDDANAAVQMAKTFAPPQDASDDAIRAYIAKLRNLGDRVPGPAAEQQIQQQVADFEQVLQRRQQPLPGGETTNAADAAAAGVSGQGAPSTDAGAQPGAADPAKAPASQQPPVEESAASMFRKAKRLKDTDLRAAEYWIEQCLKKDPNYAGARELREEIQLLRKLGEAH